MDKFKKILQIILYSPSWIVLFLKDLFFPILNYEVNVFGSEVYYIF